MDATIDTAGPVLRVDVLEITVIARQRDLIAWYERRGFVATGEQRSCPVVPGGTVPLSEECALHRRSATDRPCRVALLGSAAGSGSAEGLLGCGTISKPRPRFGHAREAAR